MKGSVISAAYFPIHVPLCQGGTTSTSAWSTILLADIQPGGENSDIAVEFAYSPWNCACPLKRVVLCRRRIVCS